MTHLLRLLLLALALTAARAAPAQPAVPPSPAAAIAAARAGLDTAKLDDAQRKSAAQALDEAAQQDEQARALTEQTAQLREQAATPLPPVPPPPPTLIDQRRQLAQWAERLPADTSADALERLLAGERTRVTQTHQALEAAQRALTDLISRPSPAPAELAALRQQASADAPAPTEGEPAALTAARALRHQAAQRRAQAELALREAEQTTAQNRQTRLEREVAAWRQQEAEHQPRTVWLEQRIATQAQTQLTRQRDALDALAQSVPPGSARELAQANAALAQTLLDHSTRLAAERDTLATQARTRDQVSAALRDTQARLRVGGNNDAMGQWLWQQRLALPSLSSLRIQRNGVQERLGRLRLDLFNSASQGDARDSAAGVMAVLGDASEAPPPGANPDTVRSRALRTTQADLQHQLEPLLRRRIEVLEQTDAALQTTQDDGDALQLLMARQLLWTPSHAPLGRDWLARWADAHLADWDVPSAWRLAQRDLTQHTAAWAVALLAVALSVALRLRGAQRLRGLAQAVADPTRDRFTHTLAALGWSLLVALPVPLATWLLGQRVQEMAAGHHAGLDTLGQSLQALADLLFTLTLMHTLLRPAGLAQTHLSWPGGRLRTLSQGWLAVLAVALPTSFITLLALLGDDAAAIDTWARLAVMAQGAGMALVTGWLGQRLAPRRAGDVALARRVGALLLPAAFGATAVMALTGYVYSAIVVQQALLQGMAVLLAVAVFDGLLRRWLLLGEQRLARRQREQARATQADGAVRDVEGGDAPAEADSELTLVTISAQTRRLLRLLRVVLISVGLLWAWAEVLPALLRFEDIRLWTSEDRHVTLMDVLGALLLLMLTASLARNLPGLLEMALTPYRRISAAGRYTATTLARYAVVIAGVVLAFGTLGLRWSQLQWMAAALTVGLGFGLQEIFANFVSGLILLVERPFRVGDTITIGELTGTVTRIHTRATTVLDYDNKEIVIPNKTFITGQVTNWTLSDNVTRLTLNVGVAYGSAPETVRELLLQAAREHPRVLPEPEPNCWCMALGASTLDFELRVYVAALGDRLPVRHELLGRIAALLSESGIEIAFPQMDVHVRNLPAQPPLTHPGPNMTQGPALEG